MLDMIKAQRRMNHIQHANPVNGENITFPRQVSP